MFKEDNQTAPWSLIGYDSEDPGPWCAHPCIPFNTYVTKKNSNELKIRYTAPSLKVSAVCRGA
jgi:hypothetical protein